MALPVALDVGVARYNPKQFTDAGIPLPDRGWTREDFVGAAQRLTQDTDNDGNVDAWGFRPIGLFANWLPFVLQEMDEDPINFDTGVVRLTDPAALRGLQFWEELGRLHKVMPHGASVTADQFGTNFTSLLSGILFWDFLPPSHNLPRPASAVADWTAGRYDVDSIRSIDNSLCSLRRRLVIRGAAAFGAKSGRAPPVAARDCGARVH